MIAERGLGRVPSPPDSRDYKLYHFLTDWPDFERDSAHYVVGPTLDQGSTPHCVGFAGVGWMNAEPVPNLLDNYDGHELYWDCKEIDGYPGDGTYVRTVAKVLKNRGRLDNYAFGNLLDSRRFLLQQGPVVFGIPWYEGFFYPDAEGVIRAVGYIAGGHAILACGADPTYCYLQNSWGTGWGIGGGCKIRWEDLAAAFDIDGEAMAAVELPTDYVPVVYPWWVRLWRWLKRLW